MLYSLLFEFQALDHRCIKPGELDAATLLDGYFSDGRGRKIMLATLEMDFTVVVYTEEGTNRFLKVLARSNMVAAAKVYRRIGHDWNSSGVRVVV
jgi:hypothetical protein